MYIKTQNVKGLDALKLVLRPLVELEFCSQRCRDLRFTYLWKKIVFKMLDLMLSFRQRQNTQRSLFWDEIGRLHNELMQAYG